MNDTVSTVLTSRIQTYLRMAILLPALMGWAYGQGSLVILDPTISGDTVTIPIHLQGNVLDGVAALDFQLSYDPAILQPLQTYIGDAAVDAGKEIQARLLADGQYVVLMFGLERSAVPQGEIVRISLNKLSDPKNGETPVTISSTKLATISGVEIPSQGSTASLLFDTDSSGGLPPVFGGGLPTGVDDTGQSSSTGDPDGSGTSPQSQTGLPGEGPVLGGGGSIDLASLRAAANERISMLQNAQAEREAARSEVNRTPANSSNDRGIRVRQTPPGSKGTVANDRGGRIESTQSGAVENNVENRQVASVAGERDGQGEGDQLAPLSDKVAAQTEEYAESGLDSEGQSRPISKVTRRTWVQAGVLAACLAVAVGVFLVQRRRGV